MSAVIGSWAARNSPTARALRTIPSVSGATYVRSEISPVYAALWATKRMIGPRSSPSGCGSARGKVRRPRNAIARIDDRVVSVCATTTPTTAAVTPIFAPIQIPAGASRSRA